jgi:integrase
MSAAVVKRCGCRRPDGSKWGSACPQLRRADGSWNPSHGSWSIRLELEPGEDGERRILRRSGYATRTEALAAIDEARGKIVRGVDPVRRVTVREFLREWLAGKRDLRATTRSDYRHHIEDVWIPALGRMDIGAVRRAHIEAALDDLDVKAATKQRHRATLRSAFADAVREGLIMVNPAALARIESGRRPKVRPLEPAELGRLLDHLAADDLGALFETLAATGLRRGEALGLRWFDVDLERGVITVRRQLVQLAGHHDCDHCEAGHEGVFLAKPKTSSGEDRMVELDTVTAGTLMEWRLRQDAKRDETYVDHGLVFAADNGNPLRPDFVTRRFAELCESAGVRKVRLHDLRHGAASLRLASGTDIAVVSKLLGHSSISITSDTYSHLLEGVGRASAERAMALVPRSRPGTPEHTTDSPETVGHTSGTPEASEG